MYANSNISGEAINRLPAHVGKTFLRNKKNEQVQLSLRRPGHLLGKNIKLHELKNEKNYVGFLMHKIGQILKRLSRALSSAKTSYV